MGHDGCRVYGFMFFPFGFMLLSEATFRLFEAASSYGSTKGIPSHAALFPFSKFS